MYRKNNREGVAPSLMCTALVVAAFTTGSAYAAKIDLNTGDTCRGADCIETSGNSGSGSGGASTSSTTSTASTLPQGVSTRDCDAADEQRIGDAVRWLRSNLAAVTAEMNSADYLMSWPGNSRENYEEKLDGDLDFYCINHKKKCADGNLRGIVYPVVAPKRINLCTDNMVTAASASALSTIDSRFTGTIAHEIGHLVRANVHRESCSDRYYRPRFSQAVGLAAEHAFLRVAYDGVDYALSCPSAGTQTSTVDPIHGPDFNKPDLSSLPR